jgi:NADPH:quinone reductase-like Zn-dependent oxidoreductase
VVSAVGEKVSHLKVGDRVMALTGWGSFAEQVAVPGYNVLPIPPSMDFNTAAAFSMTYGTSMHALKQRANLQPARPCWCSALPGRGPGCRGNRQGHGCAGDRRRQQRRKTGRGQGRRCR